MKEFDKQTLFLNIYYLWCLHHFFSMYYIWKSTALTRLEKNVKRKWVADLPNVNLFLERIREGDEKMTRKRFFLIVEVILNIFFFGRLQDICMAISKNNLVIFYCLEFSI